jgi:ABC-type antimicrobial peptide transport system permease subunit
VQSFGWTLEFRPPWGSIAWTLAAVVPACLLAGLLPALASAFANPKEALREVG